MTRRFAVFDIDGTLIRWQLYHAIGDRLAKNGIIGQADFDIVRRARMNWKKRSGEDSFNDYELALIKVFNEALAGLEVNQFKQIVGAVFDEYKDQVYMFTRDLIEELHTKNYLIFALSGSPHMIVGLLAKYYGFDDYAGTYYQIEDGRFTGKINLTVGHKKELLEALIEKHGASLGGSIGIGDSEGDIDMLSLTEQPIAFNPTQNLFKHATAASWQIVLERKNVIYKLEPSGGHYQLKA